MQLGAYGYATLGCRRRRTSDVTPIRRRHDPTPMTAPIPAAVQSKAVPWWAFPRWRRNGRAPTIGGRSLRLSVHRARRHRLGGRGVVRRIGQRRGCTDRRGHGQGREARCDSGNSGGHGAPSSGNPRPALLWSRLRLTGARLVDVDGAWRRGHPRRPHVPFPLRTGAPSTSRRPVQSSARVVDWTGAQLAEDAERARLRRCSRTPRGGRSGVLVVAGEPGVGKTALLQDAIAGADGMQVILVAGVRVRGGDAVWHAVRRVPAVSGVDR